MIKLAIFHKFFGVAAAMLMLLVTSQVFQEKTAVAIMSSLSLAQLAIPFVGLGLTQYLVTKESNVVGPTIRLKITIGDVISLLLFLVIVSFFIYQITDESESFSSEIFVYVFFVLLLISFSEIYRSYFSYQKGFALLNFSTILASIAIYILQSFSLYLTIFPIFSLLILLKVSRNKYDLHVEKQEKRRSFDFKKTIQRSFQVALISQYYNIIIVSLAMLDSSLSLLKIIFIYKLQIIFNWQNFYWMRFIHKSINGGESDFHSTENKKIAKLNIVSILFTNLLIIIFYKMEITSYFKLLFVDEEFITLVLIFSVFRILASLTFPYEIFIMYSRGWKSSLLLSVSVAIFLVSLYVTSFYQELYVKLIIFEVNLVLIRVFSWRLKFYAKG